MSASAAQLGLAPGQPLLPDALQQPQQLGAHDLAAGPAAQKVEELYHSPIF